MLGTSFLKLAQVLATRADFFDQSYLVALRQLHDQMPAMKKRDYHLVLHQAFPNPDIFSWRDEAYEFVADVPAIDLLSGSSLFRRYIEEQISPVELHERWQQECRAFEETLDGILLYQ